MPQINISSEAWGREEKKCWNRFWFLALKCLENRKLNCFPLLPTKKALHFTSQCFHMELWEKSLKYARKFDIFKWNVFLAMKRMPPVITSSVWCLLWNDLIQSFAFSPENTWSPEVVERKNQYVFVNRRKLFFPFNGECAFRKSFFLEEKFRLDWIFPWVMSQWFWTFLNLPLLYLFRTWLQSQDSFKRHINILRGSFNAIIW